MSGGTALVTGAGGFVGRHMTTRLRREGWSVVAIDNRMCPHVPELIYEDARAVFSGSTTITELRTHFDLVVHCAYHVGGRRAIDGIPSLLAANLELDAQMFSWALRTGQGAILYFSSSAAYPIRYQRTGSLHWLTEPMVNLASAEEPDARYGWAKLTGERLAAAAAEQGQRVHVVRPFSGYGHDQDQCYPFPAVLARALAGELSVWGPPGQCRDWIHIDDVVAGSLAVVAADIREPINLCTGVSTEFGRLALTMCRMAGGSARIDQVVYRDREPTGVMVRVGDPTRMLTIYRPTISLEEGIMRALQVTS